MVQEMLLSPTYREQAQRLQAANQAAGGVATAADLVERATRPREGS
jgi:UDP:flavonoid glycosyltransferase YjiC (YdhE family)